MSAARCPGPRGVYRTRICARCLGPMRSPIGFLCDPCLVVRREMVEPPVPTPWGYSTGRWIIAQNRVDAQERFVENVLGDRHQRFVRIVERDPGLEAWQLAERFGIAEDEAAALRSNVLHNARRRARRSVGNGARQ